MTSKAERTQSRTQWVASQFPNQTTMISPASSDASFRSYWRVFAQDKRFILMDAPPDKLSCQPFIEITERLQRANLPVPGIHAHDLGLGFVLLEDLGNRHLADQLSEDTVDQLFPKVFELLEQMQRHTETQSLPVYDEQRLGEELDLFPDWYLQQHLKIGSEPEWWRQVRTQLINNALEQPQCFVHRDFHAENLMIGDDEQLAMIDYQDAVNGPITYDLVSILLDRHWDWSRSQIEGWSESFRQRQKVADPDTWKRWFDLMGLQRNLKVMGIFARLNYRDGKPSYLEMIPRFRRYAIDTASRYDEFSELAQYLKDHS